MAKGSGGTRSSRGKATAPIGGGSASVNDFLNENTPRLSTKAGKDWQKITPSDEEKIQYTSGAFVVVKASGGGYNVFRTSLQKTELDSNARSWVIDFSKTPADNHFKTIDEVRKALGGQLNKYR